MCKVQFVSGYVNKTEALFKYDSFVSDSLRIYPVSGFAAAYVYVDYMYEIRNGIVSKTAYLESSRVFISLRKQQKFMNLAKSVVFTTNLEGKTLIHIAQIPAETVEYFRFNSTSELIDAFEKHIRAVIVKTTVSSGKKDFSDRAIKSFYETFCMPVSL